MKTTALICEFNPFHYGHAYILSEIRRTSDFVLAIMSGNYVQRAQAAVFDKYARAHAAVDAGADLVIELPFPWCSASAEYFASAGVALANAMGADTLAFGAAHADGSLYQRIAGILADAEKDAVSFVTAQDYDRSAGAAVLREQYLRRLMPDLPRDIMRTPNDILAVEYCKAIVKSGAPLTPHPIPRISGNAGVPLPGASALRERLEAEGVSGIADAVPEAAYRVFSDEYDAGRCAQPDALQEYEFLHFRMYADRTLQPVADASFGVYERLSRAAALSASGWEMFQRAATKKYTNARFRRAALFALLDVHADVLRQSPAYSLLLAAGERGRRFLADRRRSADFPIVTKPADSALLPCTAAAQYAVLLRADRLYTLCLRTRMPSGYYLTRRPCIS